MKVNSSLSPLFLLPVEFTVGSFCSVVDVTNFSRLLMVRLDGNELSLVDIPTDVSRCLRQVLDIEI